MYLKKLFVFVWLPLSLSFAYYLRFYTTEISFNTYTCWVLRMKVDRTSHCLISYVPHFKCLCAYLCLYVCLCLHVCLHASSGFYCIVFGSNFLRLKSYFRLRLLLLIVLLSTSAKILMTWPSGLDY
jgi:hypothetical protein